MMDILYIGNCSIDKVITKKNITENIYYGGSAVNSALVSSSLNKLKVGILSSISKDYDFDFKKYNISFLGEIKNEKPVIFKINEINSTCVVDGDYQELDNIPEITTKHLHISFRKGVSVERILDNDKIKFESMSVDVMIHSIQENKKLIEKYKDKIQFIFCNSLEYQYIKELDLENIKIVITNEEKPIIYISKDCNKCYIVPKLENGEIISKTGAGDTFIGGFLQQYLLTENVDEAIFYGISVAQESLRNYGNEKLNYDLIAQGYNILVEKDESYWIPKTIIVIGSSCAGKTTFADAFIKELSIYSNVDDYLPLKEVFDLDDLLRSNTNIDLTQVEESLKFSKEILEEYKQDINNIKFYSSPSSNGGHNIEKPILWDLILKYAVQNINDRFNLFQFSRGYDNKYEQEIGVEVYQRSIKTIIDNLSDNLKEDVIIINITSNLELRKRRNEERYKKGGHFVAEETMNSIYKDDLIFDSIIGISVINIENDKQLSSVELGTYLMYNITRVLEKYTSIRGGEK